MTQRRIASGPRPFWMLALIAALLTLGSCQVDAGTGKGAASVLGRGIVNDPTNKSLRFEMIEFGLHEFCRELLLAGAPLRLDDDQPVIGRYFAESCQTKSLDQGGSHTIIAQFGGKGYAWTAGTGRMGFRAQGLLELRPDFVLYEESMYVYFRPVQVDTSDFEVLMTERKLAQAAIQVAGLDEKDMGQAIIDAQLGRGFTVVRYDADGHTDFALGLVPKGDTPFRPFIVRSSPRETVANGRTELFADQQDYLGRLQLKKNEAITVTLKLEGTEQLDVAIVPADSGRPVLDYVQTPGARQLKGEPPFRAVLSSVAPLRAEIPLPAGEYFLVFDHSARLGSVSPPPQALPARVDYLVQLGDAPSK